MFASLAFVAAPLSAAAQMHAQTVDVGSGVAVLDGPWGFHAGDDPHWAEPDADDRSWEAVSLHAPVEANDGDVGLSRYAQGWTMKGHPQLSGYAWYRLRVCVRGANGQPLRIAAPFAVDDAYQLFVNGTKLGGIGQFDAPVPVVFSARPFAFDVPAGSGNCGERGVPVAIAIRTWLAPADLAPGSGGIHIAPALGTQQGITAWTGREWNEIFWGYLVDAVEPAIFVALAAFALLRWRTERRLAYLWLCAALLGTALLRGNNAFFSWFGIENATQYTLFSLVLLPPLVLALWTLTAQCWVRGRVRVPIALLVAALTVLLIRVLATENYASNLAEVAATAERWLRYAFALLFAATIWSALAKKAFAQAAAIAVLAVALFATELSRLNVPGIWFVLGTGVSRTQYALAVFALLVYVALERRHPPVPASP